MIASASSPSASKQLQDILQRFRQDITFIQEPAVREPYNGLCVEGCAICGGVGWVRLDVPPRSADFGKLQPCPNIPTGKRHRITGRYGLTLNEQDDLNWERILPITQAAQIAEKIKRVVETGYGLIYLHGSYGLGKTLLLKIAAAETARAGKDAAYANFSDILDDIRSAFDTNDPRDSAMERLRRWQTVPLLAIDELSRVNTSGWVQEKMFQLLDYRHVEAVRQHAVTLIASNEPPTSLSPSLADRLADGRHLILEIKGRSVRPQMTVDNKY